MERDHPSTMRLDEAVLRTIVLSIDSFFICLFWLLLKNSFLGSTMPYVLILL